MSFGFDPLVVVRVAAVVFGSLTVLAVLDLSLGTWRRNRRHARRQRATGRAFDAVVSLTTPEADPHAVAAALRDLPIEAVEEALTVAARSFGGRDRDRFREVAEAVGVHERARRLMTSRRWHRRLRGIRILRMTSTQAPVLALFDDEEPEIRAAAALWIGAMLASGGAGTRGADGPWSATGQAPNDATERLATALLDPAALVRLAAKYAVGTGGPVAVAAVEQALHRTQVEGRPALLPVAPLMAAAVLGPVVDADLVRSFLDDRDARVRAAAVRATAAVVPEETGALCGRFLDDDQVVRVAVAAVAGRHLAAVRYLVTLSADDAWQVRQGARLSLSRLGPVGRALLRRVQREAAA